MQVMVEWWSRLRSLFSRGRLDVEMAEQMCLHIELQAAANERTGMTPGEALRAAHLQFGSVEKYRAECRDERRFGVIEDAVQDTRFAARALWAEPTFAVAAILALGIGIGATTAAYSLADHALLRPVPGVRAVEELVTVELLRDGSNSTGISYANYADLRTATPALSGFAGYASASLQAQPESAAPRLIDGVAVLGDYFGVLGVVPHRGRFFSAEELEPGAASQQVAVISHRLWRAQYGGEDVLGRSVRLNANDFTIIGVTPPGFRGTDRLGTVDLWLPGPAYGIVRHFPPDYIGGRRANAFMQLFGRVAPGATPAAAEAQLRSALAGLVEQHPQENRLYEVYVPTVFEGIGTVPRLRERMGHIMTLLGAAAVLVLLIACANVANLIVFRAVRRRGELAVRRALGADSRRLLRQSLAEGLVLASAGSALGAALAWSVMQVLRAAQSRLLPPLDGLVLDLRVLGFTVLCAVVTSALVGLVGAVNMRETALAPHLRSAGAGSAARLGFIVVQVAASVVLLAGSLLLLESVERLRNVDTGMDPDGVMVFGVSLEPQGYDASGVNTFLESVTAALAGDQRITAAAAASGLPVVAAYTTSGFRRMTDDPERDIPLQILYISDGYFDALGMAVRAGQPLERGEVFDGTGGGEYATVVSEGAARLLFGVGASAVGETFTSSRGWPEGTMRVVGITGDVRTSLREQAAPAAFMPLAANPSPRSAFLIVRSPLPGRDVHDLVAAIVTALEPSLPFSISGALREHMDASLATERVITLLVTTFAGFALLLAAIGLYSIIAYSVARRRREIGIRATLGARPFQLAAFVARGAVVAALLGSALGTAAAVAGSRLLEAWLFEVDRLDPAFYGMAAAGFMLVALLAAAIPARTAAATDPRQTLETD